MDVKYFNWLFKIFCGNHFAGEFRTNRKQEIDDRCHEKVGGDFLRELGFPACVADLVEGHVKAKRYLVFK